MKLRKLLLFSVSCLLLSLFTITAYAAETEGIFTYTVSGGEATITKIAWSGQSEIAIPETLGGVPVTKLGSAIMRDSTLSFGDNYVESVFVPTSVASIRFDTFNYADLCRIIVDENNAYYSSDEYGVLFSKDKTSLLKAPCTFDNEFYRVPDTVTSISSYAFNTCLFIREMYIPDSVTTIGEQAFFQMISLEHIRLSENLGMLDQNVFALCSSLRELVIPSGVKTIKNSAVTECPALEKVIIGEGVETIESYAFESDTSLKYLCLPASIKTIQNGAFGNCTALTDFCYAGTDDKWAQVNVSTGAYYGDRPNMMATALVHTDIPADAYEKISFINDGGILIFDGEGEILSQNENSWHYWDSEKSDAVAIIIDGDIDYIGSNAFESFPVLTTVIVRTDSIEIDTDAFISCPLLETAVIFSESEFSGSSFTKCGSEMRIFHEKSKPISFTLADTKTNVIAFDYNGSVLAFDGGLSLDAYEFFDTMSVFTTVYNNIEKITFTTFRFENITLFYYPGDGPERLKVEENTLINGEIYPTVYMNGEDTPITFNTLTQGIADGSISDFTLIAKDEKHHEIVDTEIEVKQEESFIVKALRWVVTLLNKLFSLISKLK